MTVHPVPTSAIEARALLYRNYDEGIASGEFTPFIYPWCTVGSAVVILYLLVPHQNRPLLKQARYIVWLLNAVFSLYYMITTRLYLTLGYGGFMLMWAIYWTAVLLVVHDGQAELSRVEEDGTQRTKDVQPKAAKSEINGPSMNGSLDNKRGFKLVSCQSATSISHRLRVVVDLFTQFRGVGWNWQLRGLPPLPKRVRVALGQPVDDAEDPPLVGRDGTRLEERRDVLLRDRMMVFLRGYLVIDIVKFCAVMDPHFWGIIDSPPPTFLPLFIQQSAILVKVYRQLVFLCAVKFSLEMIFAMGALFFVGLLGPERIGLLGEPWMYPTFWGSFSNVLDKGLAGFWGGWWVSFDLAGMRAAVTKHSLTAPNFPLCI